MTGWAARLAALALTLLVAGSLALGARCSSASMASCSVATLFGTTPRLDVPYLVTRPGLIERMLDLAEVGAGDRVLDLGTGDGQTGDGVNRSRGGRGN